MNDNYKIVKPLGEGGFGKVYLVKNSAGREFAIKCVSIFEPSKYTLNEFEVMKNLSHPRVIKLVEFYPSMGSYNFVMEYAVNGSLRSFITRYQQSKFRLNTPNLIEFFMDIAHGVRYLHQKNIIHRDLKPENILADAKWRLKLCDFGVSKMIFDSNPKLQTAIGTLAYMSPEVYLHRPYDRSCDVWALGLIFYELAFMKYMFSSEDKARIMNFAISWNCPVADWKSRNYVSGLQAILDITVQRDPRRRWSAEEICLHPLIITSFRKREEEHKMYLEANALRHRNVAPSPSNIPRKKF